MTINKRGEELWHTLNTDVHLPIAYCVAGTIQRNPWERYNKKKVRENMNEILVNEIKKRASVIEKIEISTEETDSKYLT